ncbi:LysE family translocator [Aeromicrobium sp. 636]|uniref:LysE family translocator n=1 Tax=Aeromicrobium senzhongii TaxID=2663859 RepID=A0A8I0EX26_9ACTN|nr:MULTISPECIES: LysE family translocator [Aeromicrobium]MBC9227238.1 LysE family translocator [Aeromicrobium senzhongii]MCQ3999337.1 LysE family translocator [Aeromicrobium sp. 636]MTB88351.1 LysE family translocator [Aeromicrobium senzhongii]QNL94674.1 LysE family translocator [Aeromicrobium senzhongii]
MPTLETLATFCLAALALILLPGPSVLFVIGRSLAHGRRTGILSVLGNGLGGLPVVVAVALGLGVIVAESAVVFNVVKVVGAVYLIHLGIRAWRSGPAESALTEGAQGPVASPGRALLEGFWVGVSNPKTIVFFAAVLPQFVDRDSGAVSTQMLVLGVVFLLIALVCDSGWALLAGTARAWFAGSPSRLATVRRAGGAMMIGLGGLLLTSQRH